jgi:hypothetical protein
MHSFLNEDGILLIGNWSEFARSQNRLLAIYRQEDARVLSAWTPTRDELTNAAAKAGLSLVDSVVKAHDRLDVFVFRREFRKTRKRRPAQSQ